MFKEKLCVFIPAKVGNYNGFGYINIKIYPIYKNKFDKRFIMPIYPKLISISERNIIFKYIKAFIVFIEYICLNITGMKIYQKIDL